MTGIQCSRLFVDRVASCLLHSTLAGDTTVQVEASTLKQLLLAARGLVLGWFLSSLAATIRRVQVFR